MEEKIEESKQKIDQLIQELEKAVIGKRSTIQLMIVALLAGGHVLFEDIPGVGKTLLVKALAKAVQGTFSRVQCTPDLLPSDVLGFSVYNSQSKEFEFRPGPIFTTILLADEINRTTPRTQSALLEAMAENHATIDNNTYPLDNHFFVLATQNPIEYEGTYPLPEAQLDRFLFRLQIGYPSFDDELLLLLDKFEKVLDNLNEVLNSYEIEEIKTNVANVFVSPEVASYALQLVSATRSHAAIQLGISPRGSLSFIQAAKAYALIHGRNYVTPKDLQDLVPYVFSHRLIFYDRSLKEDEKKQIIHTLVAQIPVPVR
ncbi:AAA family ATPase [Enterococcus faecium]|uniref:AAA family ATPase n=1 Tax=Enterococcus faecium TaxID=1352 RepID=UPI0021E96C84|nr:MoxR family ATPase [Enterococcus faecium]MCV3177134.1 MoxR family ATPase [Enterococcus faecium]MCV3182185.1 MoxR family ATPase [Enterococcus faecium]MCV3184835.1 MoxR family ATPase [Enterococcus faecium]MCV3189965.1 MoxR family ATPase [Enterococcus faecium]MCW0078843.1 MoxR family ATPase [Enterococcus faecium]